MKIVCACCDVIIDKDDRTDIFLKELSGNISHLMNRLVKQEELASTIVTLAPGHHLLQGTQISDEQEDALGFAFKLESRSKINLNPGLCSKVLDTLGQV